MRTADFYDFMVEREAIRLRRAAGRPWPWTDDPILRRYKFTNVKRLHDRTTQLLKSEFYDRFGQEEPPNICLMNCAMFRYFGTIEFARAVGWQHYFDPQHIIAVASSRLARRERVFTGAYVITNQGIKAPKEEVVVNHFLKGLWPYSMKLADISGRTRSWQNVVECLRNVRGFGGTGFMAKEVILDTMFTSFMPDPPKDLNTWTPVGPGARRGAARVSGQDDPGAGLSERKSFETCVMLFDEAKDNWPERYVPLELHDIQFQLCEFDKYERVRLGQGRPRSLYRHEDIRPV